MNSIPFAKLHACGNDFLVVELDHAHPLPSEEMRRLAVAMCHRHSGVGADGVEFLRSVSPHAGAIRLYNADGSVAEISGNGTRCVAAYLAHTHSLAPGDQIELGTDAGARTCHLIAQPNSYTWHIAQNMGVPTVRPGTVHLPALGVTVEGAIVNTGNPHFILFTDHETFTAYNHPWQALGEAICFHPEFAPAQTTVEFVHVRSAGEIAIRIFERGVGPTTSSGTGTCATSAPPWPCATAIAPWPLKRPAACSTPAGQTSPQR